MCCQGDFASNQFEPMCEEEAYHQQLLSDFATTPFELMWEEEAYHQQVLLSDEGGAHAIQHHLMSTLHPNVSMVPPPTYVSYFVIKLSEKH